MRQEAEANRYYMYILSSAGGTLYVGVTNDIKRRLVEHRTGLNTGFSKRYGCKYLMYVERFIDIRAAIAREKEIKGWSRYKKVDLIRRRNLHWLDLSKGWKLPIPQATEGE